LLALRPRLGKRPPPVPRHRDQRDSPVDICVIRFHQALKLPQDLPLVIAIVSSQAGKKVVGEIAPSQLEKA
jgi:hypothetical protein